MQTLKTISTIETSSVCNLSCLYCVNRLMLKNGRTPNIMTDEIFECSLYWLQKLVDAGTQKDINMNGNGEPTLDSQLCVRIKRVKEIIGNTAKVCMSTNGITMSPQLAKDLKETGIDFIDLSTHSPLHSRRAAQMMHLAGLHGFVTHGPVAPGHNWAGQLEPEHSIPVLPKMACDPIIEGRGYISSDGDVTVCCYDYRNLGAYGHVSDSDLNQKEIKKFVLCATCHQNFTKEEIEEEQKRINGGG